MPLMLLYTPVDRVKLEGMFWRKGKKETGEAKKKKDEKTKKNVRFGVKKPGKEETNRK